MKVKNLVCFTPEEQEDLVAAGKILGAVRDLIGTSEAEVVYDENTDNLITALYKVVYELIPHKED